MPKIRFQTKSREHEIDTIEQERNNKDFQLFQKKSEDGTKR